MASLRMPTLTLKQNAKEAARELLHKAQPGPVEVLTEHDLKGLPDPVQRYLRYSGVVGALKVQTVRLRQRGYFRLGPDRSWMPLKAEEYYSVNPPGFVWFATMQAAPFVWFHALDQWQSGGGKLTGKIYGVIPMVKGEGPEFDQGELMRFLQEMTNFPGAFLNDYITWEALDDLSARATLTYNGQSVSGVFYFNEKGENTNFVAQRYRMVGKNLELATWSTPCTGYKEFKGVKLPYKGEGVWKLSEGDLPYIKVELVEIEYNKPFIYE